MRGIIAGDYCMYSHEAGTNQGSERLGNMPSTTDNETKWKTETQIGLTLEWLNDYASLSLANISWNNWP